MAARTALERLAIRTLAAEASAASNALHDLARTRGFVTELCTRNTPESDLLQKLSSIQDWADALKDTP